MQDYMQFYPTPLALAEKVWSMFESETCTRVLEPSAGSGDLLKPLGQTRYKYNSAKIDAIELNVNFHPILRENHINVVDVDFLGFKTPVSYSHIVMNPPFNKGVDHAVHAWDILINGEMVAILNAETIRNPFTSKRKHLINLIEQYGKVEFVVSAFEDPDSLRKTPVEVALVYLKKTQDIEIDLSVFGLLEDPGIKVDVAPMNELSIPDGEISNIVRVFNAAVKAMVASVEAEAVAGYYAGLIDFNTMSDIDCDDGSHKKVYITFSDAGSTISKRYDDLKENAWRRVLSCTDFSRFSRRVRSDIQDQLSDLIKMEFTEENIYSVLEGLIHNKTELDFKMMEEVFDEITKYHSDNRFYYLGWKSNDKHRLGFKLRHTRFILPNMRSWNGSDIDSRGKEIISEIDRVFAMLDGKAVPDFGILEAAKVYRTEMLNGDRLESDYFDIRFYNGVGTIHFFPNRSDLVDRLNRIVGSRRQWLPDQPADAPEEFWSQYEQCQKANKLMGAHLNQGRFYSPNKDELLHAYVKSCDQLGWTKLFSKDYEQALSLPSSEVA